MNHDWMSRLGQKKLTVKSMRRGAHKGVRPAKIPGASFDFSDFRNYELGDDIRQIDWNIYARTEKYYIKRFLDEQEISVQIFLDCSKSMQLLEKKWDMAKQLAASFSFMALANDDRLTVVSAGMKNGRAISRKGAKFAKQTYQAIMELPKQEQIGLFTEDTAKKFLKNRQLAILISDGLEGPENFELLFRKIAPFCKQVRFLQLLSSEEYMPDYTGDLKLEDSENHSALNVSISERLLDQYRKRLKIHNETLAAMCGRYGISCLQVRVEDGIQSILFHNCVKNGWLE